MTIIHQLLDWLCVGSILMFAISLAGHCIDHVVHSWYRSRAVSAVYQFKTMEEARLEFAVRDNEILRQRHEINNQALLEQWLISAGKHAKQRTGNEHMN